MNEFHKAAAKLVGKIQKILPKDWGVVIILQNGHDVTFASNLEPEFAIELMEGSAERARQGKAN